MKNLILYFLLTSSSLHAYYNNRQFDYCNAAYEMMDEFSSQLRKSNNLILKMRGGSMMKDIELLCLDFVTEKYLNISEARDLIINTSQKLISRFNSEKKIHPYLHDYPLTEKNINLTISFEKNNEYISTNDYVSLIFTKNSKIFYFRYDNSEKQFIKIFEESYNEALKSYQL